MHFKEIESFAKTSKNESEFFAKIKALKNANYLHWIMLELRRDDGEKFTFDMLSEGEKQLANLLLLLDLTKEYKALFLLDEFDSYLHPTWQREFVKLINNTDIRGQIIFTTHSPASISKVQRENVFIMKNGEVFQPLSDTFNRSLEEIMEEQILAAQEAESLEAAHDAEVNAECAEMYEAVAKDIQEMVTAVSQIIQNHPNLVEKNFSIHYQHGRIGYMDLDAFAKTVDLEKLVKAKEEACNRVGMYFRHYKYEDNILSTKDTFKLVSYMISNKQKKYTIPNYIQTISKP